MTGLLGLAGVMAVLAGMLLLTPATLAAATVFRTDSKSGLSDPRGDQGAVNTQLLETEWKSQYSENSSGPWTEVNQETLTREGRTGTNRRTVHRISRSPGLFGIG